MTPWRLEATRLLILVRRASIAAIIVYTPMILIHAYCITGMGGWVIAGVELFVFAPVVALLATIGSIPFLLWLRTRTEAFRILVFSAVVLALFIPAMNVSLDLRSQGFHLAADRARPLIAAVEAYVSDTGRPPETLQDLVPGYLPAIPEGLPELEIVSGQRAREQYGGNEWVLDSFVPTGIINWDRFMFFPNQKYPDSGYGGWIERIDRWIYVHE